MSENKSSCTSFKTTIQLSGWWDHGYSAFLVPTSHLYKLQKSLINRLLIKEIITPDDVLYPENKIPHITLCDGDIYPKKSINRYNEVNGETVEISLMNIWVTMNDVEFRFPYDDFTRMKLVSKRGIGRNQRTIETIIKEIIADLSKIEQPHVITIKQEKDSEQSQKSRRSEKVSNLQACCPNCNYRFSDIKITLK
jgi:hypothetical protein